jgi:hypothetical protein
MEENMDSKIAGKWKVESGQFKGLTYDFRDDGTFEMEMKIYGVRGSGKYSTNSEVTPHEIDIYFSEHTSGAAGIGVYKGIWQREGDKFKMKVGTANGERRRDPSELITYVKA